MDIQSAYKTLEVSPNISDDELKKKYKELAKKYHPDVSKDPETFKKINESYQLIKDYRENPHKYEPKINIPQSWGNIDSIFSNFVDFGVNNWTNQKYVSDITLNLTIDFKKSITGFDHEVVYDRNVVCVNCQGNGFIRIKNDCTNCDGFGRVSINNRGMIIQSICGKCRGKNVNQNDCNDCNSEGTIKEKRTGQVHIPAGIKNNSVLRVNGAGNFAGQGPWGDSYTDLLINVKVSKHETMKLVNQDVHSKLKLTLLEAIEGSDKDVETVYGVKKITIPPKSRNADQIKIPKCGVQNTNGMHVINLDVVYPDDISGIIEVLKNGVSNSV